MESIYKKLWCTIGVCMVILSTVHGAHNNSPRTIQDPIAQSSRYAYDYSILRKKKSAARAKIAPSDREYTYGPSDATMRQSVLGGGYLSGGQMSCSMGAGATKGHGHR
jgi:hypothetical protein